MLRGPMLDEMISKAQGTKNPKLAGWPKTAAFDLDGTVCQYQEGMAEDNEFGPPIPGIVEEMKKLKAAGWKIIIWTCRGKSQRMIKHLKKHGVPFDEINTNSSGPHDSPKIYADVYVDDRAISFDGNTKGLAERIKRHRPWSEGDMHAKVPSPTSRR